MKRIDCNWCKGRGKVVDPITSKVFPCEHCGGAGWVRGKDDEPEDGIDYDEDLYWPESIRYITKPRTRQDAWEDCEGEED